MQAQSRSQTASLADGAQRAAPLGIHRPPLPRCIAATVCDRLAPNLRRLDRGQTVRQLIFGLLLALLVCQPAASAALESRWRRPRPPFHRESAASRTPTLPITNTPVPTSTPVPSATPTVNLFVTNTPGANAAPTNTATATFLPTQPSFNSPTPGPAVDASGTPLPTWTPPPPDPSVQVADHYRLRRPISPEGTNYADRTYP